MVAGALCRLNSAMHSSPHAARTPESSPDNFISSVPAWSDPGAFLSTPRLAWSIKSEQTSYDCWMRFVFWATRFGPGITSLIPSEKPTLAAW